MYYPGDEKLARVLHERFKSPMISHPKNVYGKENENIIDSKLEYQDPTPNIRDLFAMFDRRFFWGMLRNVEVNWSNRMTTCAGLCYYKGKNGFCSIKLSAPLLSLRPRKDLVETLLHEMIHAYLFVTRNFSDREDHGPEFLKHMHRINREAGTNVTVYHNYLDEVDYYKRHIWRCNGACQKWKPYYGFVRRAMNRAPGPNDVWWEPHKQKCGGTFIKISEPEKATKKKSATAKANTNGIGVNDIRNFLTSNGSSKSPTAANNGTGPPKGSNIHTFQDLKRTPETHRHSPSSINELTYIITRKTPTEAETNNRSKKTGTNSPKQPQMVTLVDRTSPRQNENVRVTETVRNAWANKYPQLKVSPKTAENKVAPVPSKKREVTCPVCSQPFAETIINEHIDDCLTVDDSRGLNETLPVAELAETRPAPVRNPSDRKNELHDKGIIMEEDGGEEEITYFKLTQCIVCSQAVDQRNLSDHMESCLKCFFENDDQCRDDDDDVSVSVPCPCCLKWVLESKINSHIDECLTYIALKNSLS